jgi:nucleosome assembly protein 1-like 1
MAESSGRAYSEHFAGFVASHQEIETSLKSLQKLHLNYLDLNKRYQQDLLQLQNKFLTQYNDCFAERQAIINGEDNIPNFWLTAMKNNAILSSAIEPADEEALSFLRDVRIEDVGNTQGFNLVFDFNDNPFFSNSSLSKSFIYEYEEDYAGRFGYGQTTGCGIGWKPGKNLTSRQPYTQSHRKKA